MKRKFAKIIILLMVISATVVGCTNNESKNEYIQYGMAAIENMEYDKALNAFEKAKNEGLVNIDIDKLINIINDYKGAIKEYNLRQYEKAKEILSHIDEDYIKYKIRSEIEYLKNLISENH